MKKRNTTRARLAAGLLVAALGFAGVACDDEGDELEDELEEEIEEDLAD